MAKQKAAIEVNQFVAGLNTDSSPLTSVENTSLDEENMILNVDGSRQRRLGMEYEDGFAGVSTTKTGNVAISTFKWTNAGGDPTRNILVVQTGTLLKFFTVDGTALSGNLISSHTVADTTDTQLFQFAVVDGVLVVASNAPDPSFFEYDAGTITQTTKVLRIRDFFGVEDIVDTTDLLNGRGIQIRPATLPDAHLYNLRNQSWGIPRIHGDASATTTPAVSDPITSFQINALAYPSNSDVVTHMLYPDPENADNRTIDRFWSRDAASNPPGNTRAPNGYFIIDALARGVSRLANEAYNYTSLYPALTHQCTDLPEDTTPGGPTVVAEFAGRVFYAGFSGEVTDGDAASPRMSSYILFSQLANSIADMANCYSAGDPTSAETPDILDTDGGFIRINGAFNIQRLVNIGSSLLIIAENGVWRVTGTDDSGFTATKYVVDKLSDRGCSSSDSVVLIENTVMFWGEDGIFHVTTDQFGSWVVQDITIGKIETLYKSISLTSKQNVKGSYDPFDGKVRWMWNIRVLDTDNVRELVLDTSLKAFYLNRIMNAPTTFPRVVAYHNAEPYTDPLDNGLKEIAYLVVSANANISITFASYKNEEFLDWGSEDAEAYVVTGYVSAGDFQRKKSLTYLTTYLRKTETGFVLNGDGDFDPVGSSSCMVQMMWEWANSDSGGKWGTPFQAYRHRRLYIPPDVDAPYDDGNAVVVTKNRVRGNGRVLSIKFSTEAGKNFHLYGWSMVLGVTENV